MKIDTRQIKPNRGIWWRLRHIEGDSEIHLFSLTQMLELTGFSHMSDFFQQNQIYTSKWYDNYNIALRCGVYRGLIFSLTPHHFPFGQVPSSVNSKLFFFLPFTCLCPFFWSVVIPRSLPLWTWLFWSSVSVLVWVPVLPSGSTAWFWSPGSGSLVLVPWSWLPGPGPSVLAPWFLWPRLHCIM